MEGLLLLPVLAIEISLSHLIAIRAKKIERSYWRWFLACIVSAKVASV